MKWQWVDRLGSALLFLGLSISVVYEALQKISWVDYITFTSDQMLQDVFMRGVWATVFSGAFALGVVVSVRWGIKNLIHRRISHDQ